MDYNFDKGINRHNTACLKWDFVDSFYGGVDLLPLWVADMDFEAPKEVVSAIVERAKHGAYGYTAMPEAFYTSFINWVNKRHSWSLEKEWLCFTPGVVAALNLAILSYTRPGDEIVVQSPVYYPFMSSINNNDRELVYNPLIFDGKSYKMDLEGLEKLITPKTKMLILCNPHNPVGRVWTREELLSLGDICLKHNILIVSDEIHCDLIFKPKVHIPIASLSEELAQNTITCMAPSKTFNLAGLMLSSIIIPSEKLRAQFNKTIDSLGLIMSNIFGITAFEAAYTHGEPWLEALLPYLKGNCDYAINFIKERLPMLKPLVPEGTYLLWVDFNALKLSDEALKSFIVNKAKLALDEGIIFGPGGEGFQRINLACPRHILKEALERLEYAIKKL